MSENKGEYVKVTKDELQDIITRCKAIFADNLISEQTKKDLYDALAAALSSDADFRAVFEKFEAAEQERKKTVHDVLTADPEFMRMLQELKEQSKETASDNTPAELLEIIAAEMGVDTDDENGIQAAREEYNENGLQVLNKPDAGKNYVSTAPFVRSSLNPELRRKGIQFINPETGEIAIFKLLSGFMTPAEIDFVEAIIKFYDQGQITKDGYIWCTGDQLGRAQGRQNADGSLTKKQREEIQQTIEAMSSDERRVSVEFNNVFQLYGGFEAQGLENYRIIDYYRWKGKKVRGKPVEYLYVVKFSEALKVIAGFMANNVRFGTVINQEVKNVKALRYAVEFDKPTEKGMKQTSVRTFATEQERDAFIRLNGITSEQIIREYTEAKPYSMTKQRISIRQVVFNFAISYYRARNARTPSNYDPRLPYAKIWEACRADGCTATESTTQRNRNIEIVHTMFEWLKHCGVISDWKPYRNANSRRDDGVRISIAKEIEGGA